ncbi:MAG: hypothetical protein RRC34_12525 [Lentisphaeria bacterium]|nr:hypothetical protein [Lentisphaeria bacterium]
MSTRKKWRKLRAPFAAAALRVVVWVVVRLRYSHLAKLAAGLGWIAHLSPAVRRLIRANLRVAFPDWEDREIRTGSRIVIQNSLLTSLEFIWFSAHPGEAKKMISHADDKSRDKLQQTLNDHIPTLFITPHLGNWELAARFACEEGIRVSIVARKQKIPGLEDLISTGRQGEGLTIYPQEGAARGMMTALKKGEAVGVLMDQNVKPRRGGVFVDFFGLPVPATRAPAALARKMKADAICFACVRQGDAFQFHMKTLPKPAYEYGDDLELTQALLKLNEEMIAEFPLQYTWLYERWRYIPEGADQALIDKYPYYKKRS